LAADQPGLTRKTWEPPANVGKYRGSEEARPTQRGWFYALAPSRKDGQVHLGRDGRRLIHRTREPWKDLEDVTPPSSSSLGEGESSSRQPVRRGHRVCRHHTLRLDDLRPHILRTHDGGKTAGESSAAFPEGGIRERGARRPGPAWAAVCGTEQAVYVSFADRDGWPLLLNHAPRPIAT